MDVFSWQLDPAWVYYASAVVLVLLSIAAWLLTLVSLPGNWLIVGCAALFTWLFPEEAGRGMTWTAVFVLIGVALLGELIEFGAGAAGAAKQGASRRSVALSVVGAMVGSIAGVVVGSPLPVLGSFVGALFGGAIGAFAGGYVGEFWKGRGNEDRFAVGQGAFVGKLWGTAGKLVAGAIMLAIVAWGAFF